MKTIHYFRSSVLCSIPFATTLNVSVESNKFQNSLERQKGGGFREAGIPGSSLFSSGIPVLDRNIAGIPVFGMPAGTDIFTKTYRYFGKVGENYRYSGI